MILIGGQALRNLGSSRHTKDTDYLIYDDTSELFVEIDGVDYCNAAKSDFFSEIYKIEKGNDQASPQSLIELKAYAFVQHCQNFNFQKADDCEFDIRFLARKFNIREIKIANKYMTDGQIQEIEKILKAVKK